MMEYIKKFFIWLCTVILDKAAAPKENEEIEKLAIKRKKDVSNRIRNTPASDIAKEHHSVRRAVESGITRFRQRCGEYYEDSRRRDKENQ